MAFVLADRVQETSTTTGNGIFFTLSGAVAGYRTFDSAIGVNNNTYYAIVSASGTEWEVGSGTVYSSTSLYRETVLSSSNGGSRTNFSAGTKNVFVTMAASKAVTTNTPAFPQFTVASGTSISAGAPVALQGGYARPVTQASQAYSSGVTSVGGFMLGNMQGVTTNDPSGNGAYPILFYVSANNVYGDIGYLGYSTSNVYAFSSTGSQAIQFTSGSLYSVNQFSASYDRVAKRVQIHYANSGGNTVMADGAVNQTSYISPTTYNSSYSVTGNAITSMAQTYCVNDDCTLAFYIDNSNNLRVIKYYKNSPTGSYTNSVSAVTIGSGFSAAGGYYMAASYDEVNGSAILLIQDITAGTVNGYAIKANGNSSTAPVAGPSVAINASAVYSLSAGSIAYVPGFGGCLYAYVTTAAQRPDYVRITALGTTLTVGSPVTYAVSVSGLTQFIAVGVQSAAMTGGTYGCFSYLTNNGTNYNYYIESFNAYNNSITLSGSTANVTSTSIATTRWLAGTFQPQSSVYDFAFFSVNSTVATYYQANSASSNYSKFIGIAQAAASTGQAVSVAPAYTISTDTSTSYTYPTKYYCTAAGALTDTVTPVFIGNSLSSTQIAVGSSPGFTS